MSDRKTFYVFVLAAVISLAGLLVGVISRLDISSKPVANQKEGSDSELAVKKGEIRHSMLDNTYDLRPMALNIVGKPPLLHSTSFVIFPQDANANFPMCFGGKFLTEMDRCAAIGCRRFLYFSTTAREGVTVGMNNIRFHKPGQVKDLIYVTSSVRHVGEKSISFYVYVERELPGERELLVDGDITFVAYDPVTKKPVAHGLQVEIPEVPKSTEK